MGFKMRIALVSSHPVNVPGGVQEHVKGLYKYLKKRGHYVKIISPNTGLEKNKGDIIYLGIALPIPSNESTSHVSYCIDQSSIEKVMKKEKFDIIHIHNLAMFLGSQILDFSAAKNIFTIHTLPEASYLLKTFSIFFDILFSSKQTKINKIILVSKPILKYLPKGLNSKIRVIPNGIDLERFRPDIKKLKIFNDDKINILFVGRLDKRKGTIYLIQSFEKLKRKHNNIRLIIAGNGPLLDECKSYVESNNIQDVHFEGRVSDIMLPRYYSTSDIFCSPATHGESFGIVLLEAMACGKPIVAFANTGYKGVLKGEGAKFLVKPMNVNELTKKLETLIKDKGLREKMGKWGLKEVKKYDWNIVTDKIIKTYNEP